MLLEINMIRPPAIRDEGEVSNERIPLGSEKVPKVDQVEVNEEVPPPEPQGHGVPKIPPIHQDPQVAYVEGDIMRR